MCLRCLILLFTEQEGTEQSYSNMNREYFLLKK